MCWWLTTLVFACCLSFYLRAGFQLLMQIHRWLALSGSTLLFVDGMASNDVPWLMTWILLITALLQLVQWFAVDLMCRGLLCRDSIPSTTLHTIWCVFGASVMYACKLFTLLHVSAGRGACCYCFEVGYWNPFCWTGFSWCLQNLVYCPYPTVIWASFSFVVCFVEKCLMAISSVVWCQIVVFV
jgi:hypothetical protein